MRRLYVEIGAREEDYEASITAAIMNGWNAQSVHCSKAKTLYNNQSAISVANCLTSYGGSEGNITGAVGKPGTHQGRVGRGWKEGLIRGAALCFDSMDASDFCPKRGGDMQIGYGSI